MLYKIQTNDVGNRLFNFSLTNRGDETGYCGLEDYECQSEDEPLPHKIPGFRVKYLKKPMDHSLFKREYNIETHNGKKSVPLEKIPDFWTTGPFPTISRECKEYIEEVDSGVHQFIPLKVWDGKTDELYTHTEYFRFICGRLIEVPPHDEVLAESQTDISPLHFRAPNRAQLLEARIYRQISDSPKIQTMLESFPIWRFNTVEYEGRPFGNRRNHYANKPFVKGAQKRGLKGFKETSPARLPKGAINPQNKIYYTKRDVSHVWY